LEPRSEAEIDLVLVELVVDREAIAVTHEFIRVAEQAVEAGIALERIHIVIRVVGGSAAVIGVVIVELQHGVLAQRLRIR